MFTDGRALPEELHPDSSLPSDDEGVVEWWNVRHASLGTLLPCPLGGLVEGIADQNNLRGKARRSESITCDETET